MPQFVILRHTLPDDANRPSHFDLMLEHEGQLLTWALHGLPTSVVQTVEELVPHRIAYLRYEGPVSNGRGSVARVDQGQFDWLVQSPHTIAEKIEVQLHGKQSRGKLTLRRVASQFWEAVLDDGCGRD